MAQDNSCCKYLMFFFNLLIFVSSLVFIRNYWLEGNTSTISAWWRHRLLPNSTITNHAVDVILLYLAIQQITFVLSLLYSREANSCNWYTKTIVGWPEKRIGVPSIWWGKGNHNEYVYLVNFSPKTNFTQIFLYFEHIF